MKRKQMRKLWVVVVFVVVVGVSMVGFRWYSYVTNADSPYDEVGIALNSRMPYPLRKWGCDQLHETFSRALPPYGCKAEGSTGRDWL